MKSNPDLKALYYCQRNDLKISFSYGYAKVSYGFIETNYYKNLALAVRKFKAIKKANDDKCVKDLYK